MGKIIVTAGQLHSDIDVLACSIAYCELLVKEGKDALSVLKGPLNKSVTKTIKAWKFNYKTRPPDGILKFVIVDMSNPEVFADFVVEKNVIEVFDHHFGFDNYWKEKLGDNSHIEPIGACATLIWEEYKKRDFLQKISTVSANLLYTAIISNTLNFKASITNERDIKAFKELKKYINLSENWIEDYFNEQEAAVYNNPQEEIINDTHTDVFPNSPDTLTIGQLELWNSFDFFEKHLNDIKVALKTFGSPYWLMSSPSISEGINYIYAENKKVQNLLEEKLSVNFEYNLAKTKKLLLRKEIKKILYNY